MGRSNPTSFHAVTYQLEPVTLHHLKPGHQKNTRMALRLANDFFNRTNAKKASHEENRKLRTQCVNLMKILKSEYTVEKRAISAIYTTLRQIAQRATDKLGDIHQYKDKALLRTQQPSFPRAQSLKELQKHHYQEKPYEQEKEERPLSPEEEVIENALTSGFANVKSIPGFRA